MRQFISALILTFFSVLSVNAQPLKLPPMEADAMTALKASPRHGEWVKYDAGQGDKVDAWVVYPERSDKAPVVILIHEIFGLTDWAPATAGVTRMGRWVGVVYWKTSLPVRTSTPLRLPQSSP